MPADELQPSATAASLVRRAGRTTIGALFRAQTRLYPGRIAIESDGATWTYAALNHRINRTASILAAHGVRHGDRVAVLSENRPEYLEVQLACAKLGAIAACQNWRLSPPELAHCLGLVTPRLVLASPRHAGLAGATEVLAFGPEWERRLAAAGAEEPPEIAADEDPLLILYTSGTTGLPKGAVLTHRCEVMRMMVMGYDLGVRPGNTILCWQPLYHMGGTEPAWHALLTGGRVIVIDGFDPERIAGHIETETFNWVSIMPGTLAAMIAVLERRGTRPKGVVNCGVMADLSPPHEVQRVAALLGADFLNCFGSTETGTPPLSARRLKGGATDDLGKAPSAMAEIRLVDTEEQDVPDGVPGELLMRGPTLFSGYWQNDRATMEDFRDGWFHMGDVFRRRPDGLYDFVDRAKYMIKSGGENIYPAEIERVIMSHPDVVDAVVVRRRDARWGEVPVALVVTANPALDRAVIAASCRRELAGYKQPKEIRLVPPEQITRSTSGKVQRKALELWVAETPLEP